MSVKICECLASTFTFKKITASKWTEILYINPLTTFCAVISLIVLFLCVMQNSRMCFKSTIFSVKKIIFHCA